jgi:hypothetical protein
MHRHDAGVLQLAADLRLFAETADHGGLLAVLLVQDLDGEVAIEPVVVGAQDNAMPPWPISSARL